jgi:hypothetical protein
LSANVQYAPAIDDFRAALCTFITEARQSVAALEMESRRAVEYISHDQAKFWHAEARRGQERVQAAKIAMHNAKTFKTVADHAPSLIEEKKELEKQQRRLKHAEDKAEAVRYWSRVAEQAFREYQAKLAQFVSMLDGDLPKSVGTLERVSRALERYLALAAPTTVARESPSESEAQSMAMPDSTLPETAPDAGVATEDDGAGHLADENDVPAAATTADLNKILQQIIARASH